MGGFLGGGVVMCSSCPGCGAWGVWDLETPLKVSSHGRGMGWGLLGWGGSGAWLSHSGSVAEMLDLGERVTESNSLLIWHCS